VIGAKELLKVSEGVRILYVEDDEKLREDTFRLLSTFFKLLSVATNGREALDLYEPGRFDIVISDFVMPEMDGNELTRQIKFIHKDQLVIILSAHDEPHYIQKLKESGVDAFIFKPLNIQQFIDIMYESCKEIQEHRIG